LKLWSKNISYLKNLISNCNLTIAFFDKLEEIKRLYPQESKFRTLIKDHIRNLLAMQKEYWRQRFNQRIIQFGDENTKFFHSMATERYRKNVISQILDPYGRMVSDNGEKSALFFQEFKNRLGFSVNIMLQFDLQALIMPHPNLEHLCLPFSRDEINRVILEMPNDKAPGVGVLDRQPTKGSTRSR
jgi:hypothetical protein